MLLHANPPTSAIAAGTIAETLRSGVALIIRGSLAADLCGQQFLSAADHTEQCSFVLETMSLIMLYLLLNGWQFGVPL